MFGLNFGDAVQETWFDLNLPKTEPYESMAKDFEIYPLVSVQLALLNEKVVYKRSIYTFLDLLGDVGGLLDGLRIFGGMAASLYTCIFGNPLIAFIVNAVYKVDKKTSRSESPASELERISKRTHIKMLACQCLRGKKHKKLLERATERTDKVLEIDNFIKTQI